MQHEAAWYTGLPPSWKLEAGQFKLEGFGGTASKVICCPGYFIRRRRPLQLTQVVRDLTERIRRKHKGAGHRILGHVGAGKSHCCLKLILQASVFLSAGWFIYTLKNMNCSFNIGRYVIHGAVLGFLCLCKG